MAAAKPRASPAFLGLRTVVYPVEDLAKAKAWYSRALGQEPYFDQPFYVSFSVGGYELGLDPDVAGLRRGDGPTAYWGVSDIAKAMAHLESVGARPHKAVQEVGEGIKVASVRDPFGNVLGVIENPSFRATA